MTRRKRPDLTPLERRYSNTSDWPIPPADIPGGTCTCGCVYMDNEPGWDSHEIVFGHRPRAPGHTPPEDDVPHYQTKGSDP